MNKGALITIGFLLLVSGLSFSLIWGGSKYECEICMEYKGLEECQMVKGMSKEDTVMTGMSTACGGLANGMTETIECQANPPTKKVCRDL